MWPTYGLIKFLRKKIKIYKIKRNVPLMPVGSVETKNQLGEGRCIPIPDSVAGQEAPVCLAAILYVNLAVSVYSVPSGAACSDRWTGDSL